MKEQSITVALRVRPINSREVRVGAKPIARTVDKNMVVLMDPNRDSDDILRAKRSHDHCYMFDVALGLRATQREVYQETSQRLVSKVINGYNATVFAYGPTGAGKTYTMLGKAGEPGIMALTLNDLFKKMEQNKGQSQYHVTMAYLEIYNETVRNLLGPSSAGILDLREDAHGATIVSGLSEIEVRDTQEVMALLYRGNLRRTCEPTAVNKTSSRSHAILKVTVEQQSRVRNICQKIRTGVLFMIDLAGSERAANTQNRGLRMKEGAHINRSLLALANCINTLCSGGQYVNYRDSKLTRLLKDALSGNSFTVMIAHISPASSCYEESKNTLKYADRVKHLKTKVSSNIVEVGQHVSQYKECFDSMQSRIAELEQQLGCKDGEGDTLCAELRTLLQREKEIRQEMVSLEHQLLLIAIERQRHTATIQDSDRGTSSPSSLPPSTLSPLPTTLEDTGQTSLLFERPSNWFSAPGHMMQASQDTEDTVTSSTAHDSHVTTTDLTHDSHVTTDLTHDSHMTITDLTHDSHVTTDSTTEGTHDGHVTTTESSDNHVTSPDSGFPAQNARAEDESEEVYLARTALVGLQMDRQRTEARHRRLGRKLMEVQTKKSQLQERISSEGVLHPRLVELCVVLQLCSELEEEGRQRELAMARASLQLGHQETALDGLLDLNQQLVTALQQYRTLMEERSVSPPFSLPPLQPLISQNTSLTRRVARERRLPVTGRGLQLPTFAMLSARLCATAATAMAGSKSNLLIEDVTDGEGEEEEELKLSTTSAPDTSDNPLPSLPISSLPQDSSLDLPFYSSFSLPPIPHTTSLITPLTTTHTTHTIHTSHDDLFPNLSLPAVSNAPNILSHAPLSHTPPSQVAPHSISTQVVNSTLPSSKRMSARSILSKVTFTAPQISVSQSSSTKSKYVYTPVLIQREGDATVNAKHSETVTNVASTDSHRTESTQSKLNTDPTTDLDTPHPSGALALADEHTLTAKSVPAVNMAVMPETKDGWKEGGREVSLQSLSQLSLSRSTPVKVGREAGRVAKNRFRPRVPQSSIPVVKITEQRTKRMPLRAPQKPRNSLPILPKRKGKECQPLIPSKVIAGTMDKMTSPYLNTTAKAKSGAKQAAPKKANSTHPLPKFKSPYHIPMAKINKTRK